MPRRPAATREQIVTLARAGRSSSELAVASEPSEQTINDGIVDAAANRGARPGVLTGDEREELNRVRRENRRLKVERDILGHAAGWFARGIRNDTAPCLRRCECESGHARNCQQVSRAGRLRDSYPAWRARAVSRHARLDTEIRAAHARSDWYVRRPAYGGRSLRGGLARADAVHPQHTFCGRGTPALCRHGTLVSPTRYPCRCLRSNGEPNRNLLVGSRE